MNGTEKAVRRLGVPRDTCKECGVSFRCKKLDILPEGWGTVEERKREHRRIAYSGEPVRFLVREAPQVVEEDGTRAAVQFHGVFCSEDCARSWMEPRAKAMGYCRNTLWAVYTAEWAGPASAWTSARFEHLLKRFYKSSHTWIPLGEI